MNFTTQQINNMWNKVIFVANGAYPYFIQIKQNFGQGMPRNYYIEILKK
jgi:hypothetical protein